MLKPVLIDRDLFFKIGIWEPLGSALSFLFHTERFERLIALSSYLSPSPFAIADHPCNSDCHDKQQA
ncbi:hypothetical protein PO124_15370 [Bacillus licheniformis]|nr:hypothetical protein [Bacillus licheniformis]